MSDTDIIRMANQIADNFSALPEDEAVAGIAGHMTSFWERRMRDALARLADAGDTRLRPLVLRAAAAMPQDQSFSVSSGTISNRSPTSP